MTMNTEHREFIRSNINALINHNAVSFEEAKAFARTRPAETAAKDAARYQLRDAMAPIRVEGRQEEIKDRGQYVYLPFDGFCYTLAGDLVNGEEESERDYVRQEFGDYAADMVFDADTSDCHDAIARRYVELYQYELSLELDISELNGAFEYAGIEYSHDYYQSNDELSCFVPLSALRAVLRAVCSDPDRLEAFTNAVRTRMTPHSGWSPFFSTDWKEWGPIANWNAGQVQILLETVVDAERMNESYLEDLSDACREAMRINWEECRAAADRNEAA